MGVVVSDFVQGKISDKAIMRACQYAQISLTRTFNRMGSPYFDRRLRRIVIGVAAESVFLDWLQRTQIPYRPSGRTKWYEVDRYDIEIKGYKCDLKSLRVDSFPHDRKRILNWCALVPVDQVHHKRESADIYVFAYVAGHTQEQQSTTPSIIPSTYLWLTHIPWSKEWWNRSEQSGSLGHLRCYVICQEDTGKEIELGGTLLADGKRVAFKESIELSRHPVQTRHEFHELLYIRWIQETPPVGAVVIESSQLREEIPPCIGFLPNKPRTEPPLLNGWYDIWLYDAEAIIVGWAWKSDVLKWQRLPHHSQCEPVSATQTENYFAYVRQLRPLRELISLSPKEST